MGNKFLNKVYSVLFYLCILIFIIAFNFAHNPPSGWYQQFLPNTNGASINDINFTDSLNGFIVTSISGSSSYILKTTNGGDNWTIIYTDTNSSIFNKILFLNSSTGYVGGFIRLNFSYYLLKTTNGGNNWFNINTPTFTYQSDMSILNEDTIWFAMDEGFTGGVFRTTNGGLNWTQQVNLGGNNPTNIYMYNKDTGFVAGTTLYKTTNSGLNWLQIPGGGFGDMYFINAITGWKCYGPIQKTTDGGNSWLTLPLPPKGGIIDLSRIINFDNVNTDTIWGVGSVAFLGPGQFRGLIYKSTNGGQSWGYQLPDTSIHSGLYQCIQFTDRLRGWAYWGIGGIRTTVGGDTTYYTTSINQVVSPLPSNFKLHQNYPNPFNPLTKIKYELKTGGFIKLKIFNVEGREVRTIVNERQNAGMYEVDFSATEYGTSLSSGVYFYSLFADEQLIDTRKMMVIK